MSQAVVQVWHVSKRYRLGESTRSLRQSLTVLGRAVIAGRRPEPPGHVWSLQDVTFEVSDGHALAIIGRNGAGKTTLLRILARITAPTCGVSRTRGRIASLLEVGTGFHHELTGRENIFLNGAILGMSRRDMTARFDDIVEFAGVARFLDTPVKRYSSGMCTRLAFAIAAHLEPDILVVDEVLAVGDAEFQRRCLHRMSQAEREGRTIIFVSHDLEAATRLCPTAIWLDRGTIAGVGPTGDVVAAYIASAHSVSYQNPLSDPHEAAGIVGLHEVSITTVDGALTRVLPRDRPFDILITVDVLDVVPALDFAIYVQDGRGVRVLDEAWSDRSTPWRLLPGRYIAAMRVPPVLTAGDYTIGVWAGSAYDTIFDRPAVGAFRLEGSTMGRPDRVVALGLDWSVRGWPGAEAIERG